MKDKKDQNSEPHKVLVKAGEVKVEVSTSVPIQPTIVFPNRPEFYKTVRAKLGPLKQSQVDGFEHIFERWQAAKLEDARHLAYMKATAWHETAFTMQPVSEYGKGKGRAYGRADKRTGQTYYGRGFVQLTWHDNYAKYGIEENPDKALDPDFAAFIMIDGMTKGVFTGRKLGDYFNAKTNDAINARRIINGTDKAEQIARYHNIFLAALKSAEPTIEVKVT